MSATYEVKGSIAVITLNNPPVNGLGHATRTGIFEGLKKAMSKRAVKAVVITGAGKAFSGGAEGSQVDWERSFMWRLSASSAPERARDCVSASSSGRCFDRRSC